MPNFMATLNRVSTHRTLSDLIADGADMLCVVGHLGRDPETRYTGNGKAVTKGTLAVSWGKRGDPDQATEWVAWVAWERQAEIMGQFGKGDSVLLIGRLSQREYNEKLYPELTVWSAAVPVWQTDEKGTQSKPVTVVEDEDIPF